MSRISYRCLPEERKLPIAERTQWDVYVGGRCVGCIRALKNGKRKSHAIRVWSPTIYEGFFSPFEFPHADEDDDPDELSEPYVLTNDEPEIEHQLELHHPTLMTMHEARQWVRSIVNQE